MMPELAAWRWALGILCAFVIGLSKTGAPGGGTMTAPLMVLTVGDARHAPAWTAPVLILGDIFAVTYWRRQAETRALFSLVPWVAVGMAGGAAALSLSDRVLRRIVAGLVWSMIALNAVRRWKPDLKAAEHAPLYGVSAGFATTVATSAGPVMSLYLLTKRLPKEQFVATGAWFFFAVNLLKLPIYAAHGLFSVQSLVFGALMAPPAICGACAGLWMVRRIPQRVFEILVIVLTAVSSLFLFG